MTCIAYLRDGEDIILGSDRCTSTGDRKEKKGTPKFFKKPILVIKKEDEDEQKKIHVVIALTGLVSISNFIKYGFTAPEIEEGENFRTYLAAAFLPKLRKDLKKAGIVKIVNDETDTKSTFLMIYQGVSYIIEDNLGFVERSLEYDAFGSGERFALGSFATTNKKMKPEKRVKTAIISASKHLGSVDDNVDIVRLRSSDYE